MKTCEHLKQKKGTMYASKEMWLCEQCYFRINKTS